jgi:hypothetical protein
VLHCASDLQPFQLGVLFKAMGQGRVEELEVMLCSWALQGGLVE